ncbi:thioredoxin family protein [Bernardetia litoralis]|nr:thioredoxin family protein [Bernardetia litoralis]
MKFKLTYFLLFLSITFSISAQNNSSNFEKSKNIVFTPLSFEKALQKAKKENKIIFIDAYTSWCKPCKLMDRNVFTDSTVASVFNQNFINLKIDMESETGKPLNSKYEVEVYPTFLFIDFEGNLNYKKEGFLNAIELKNLGQEITQLKQQQKTIQKEELQNRLYEKAKIDYQKNPCQLEFVEAYFNLIDKKEKEEIQKVQSDYVECIEKNQIFSKKEVEFLLNNLTKSRNDIAYTFYLKNKPKFEKSYGDSLLVLESYLEEIFFMDETDTLIYQIGEREKLTSQEIEEFEKITTRYTDFSKKIEKESREKGFERPIKNGFVDYLIYTTAIQFYDKHKELDKFATYLVKYNHLEKLEGYKRDIFGKINIPLRSFALYTADYLENEDKKPEAIKGLSLIWKGLIGRGYINSYADHVIAAKVFYYNKEKEEAQKVLQKLSKAKKNTFEQKVYEKLEAQINEL